MPGVVRKRKMSAEKEGELKFRILDILESSENSMNLDDIKASAPMILGGYTTQKLSRLLNSLIEAGLVRKSQSKSTGRMMYKTVSKMLEQGYEIEESIPQTAQREYNGVEWDFEDQFGRLTDEAIHESNPI